MGHITDINDKYPDTFGGGEVVYDPQQDYVVAWTIDVSAASPREAAEKALAIQCNPESIATIFTASAASAAIPVRVVVDLTYGSETEIHAIPQEFHDKFVRGFVLAGAWVDAWDHSDPADAPWNGGNGPERLENADPDTIDDHSFKRVVAECKAFVESEWTDLAGLSPDQAGHDFWLTRNGHGAGYYDRGLGTVGDRLTAAAKVYGSCSFTWDGNELTWQEG